MVTKMKIYNTLTRKKEEFIPIEEGKVRMYVCGPTVYNYIHIGNARPVIFFDTVKRYFEYRGYDVNYVSNYTDVDDKIIKKAQEEGVSAREISERYIKEYQTDLKNLNVKTPTHTPKATQEIDGMIKMISGLIEKGYAYEKNGTVYYKTRRFDEYGKLSKKNLDDLEVGIRIAVDEEKEDSMDFVLWKPKKPGEPSWPSPWGDGRPGWHIECSVMSTTYLGDEIDIHGGGEDLIFPHHENEIAQTEAYTGKTMARYWMHNGFLNIDNKKMSKSEGNFFTVREIGEQYPLSVIRFFMLSAHYRSPINFSKDLVESSKHGLERIQNAIFSLEHLLKIVKNEKLDEGQQEILDKITAFKNKFNEAMDDDFNTADAISIIFEMVKLANSEITEDSSKELIEIVLDSILDLCDVLGIEGKKEEELLDSDIEQKIQERNQARANKDFAKSDAIRDELLEKGIILEDTREGVRWKRV